MTAQSGVAGGMPDDVQRAYRRAVSEGHTPDIAQERIAVILDEIHAALVAGGRRWWRPAKAIPGLYLWGGGGRGKTWLMDLFYHRLAGIPGRRWHFHQFMMSLHHALGSHPPQTFDRLTRAVLDLTAGARVVCLDEFFVADIGDAMLLTGVLQTLLQHKITQVATLNSAPQDVYRDGLQRARFQPAVP